MPECFINIFKDGNIKLNQADMRIPKKPYYGKNVKIGGLKLTPLKIIMADDEVGVLLFLETMIEEIEGVRIVGKAENAADTIKLVEEQNPDAVFLDINMPDMNGIELAKKIRETKPHIYIIFVTDHKDYIMEAVEVYFTDYILKPVNEKRLTATIKRLQQTAFITKEAAWFTVKDDDGIADVRIEADDILYFEKEKEGRFAVVKCVNGKEYKIRKPLQEIEEEVNADFLRSHKSFIINLKHVDRIVNRDASFSVYRVKFKNSKDEVLVSRDHIKKLRLRLN